MKQEISFVIQGDPEGKERPKFSRRNHRINTYTPQRTHNYEDLVRYQAVFARNEQGITEPVNKPCSIKIKACFKVPKSYSKRDRELCLSGRKRPSKTPDSDNIAKIILDGMNPKKKTNRMLHKKVVVKEGFFDDDKQVVELSVGKWFAKDPHVEVVVSWEE